MMHYTHSRRAFIQGSVGALALSALAACSSGDSKGSGSSKPAAKEGRTVASAVLLRRKRGWLLAVSEDWVSLKRNSPGQERRLL